MQWYNDRSPVREVAGELKSVARHLEKIADHLAEISQGGQDVSDVCLEISKKLKEAIRLVHEMPDSPRKSKVMRRLFHVQEYFEPPQEKAEEILQALSFVRELPENEVKNKLGIVRLLESVEHLVKKLPEAPRRG